MTVGSVATRPSRRKPAGSGQRLLRQSPDCLRKLRRRREHKNELLGLHAEKWKPFFAVGRWRRWNELGGRLPVLAFRLQVDPVRHWSATPVGDVLYPALWRLPHGTERLIQPERRRRFGLNELLGLTR